MSPSKSKLTKHRRSKKSKKQRKTRRVQRGGFFGFFESNTAGNTSPVTAPTYNQPTATTGGPSWFESLSNGVSNAYNNVSQKVKNYTQTTTPTV